MKDDMEEFVEIVNDSDENVPLGLTRTASLHDVEDDTSGKNKERKLLNINKWAITGRDYYPTESTVDKLKPGQYSVKYSNGAGFYLSERAINLDDLLVLPDSNAEMVLAHIENFWKNEAVFREYGFLWKRGIMLWGPPGSGKTSAVQQLSKQIVDLGGITIYCTEPSYTSNGLDVLRRIEPNRPIVVIFEDIDSIIQSHGESELLAMLDGELQIDNVVFVATTNYPGKLDKRFINRPSRFDEIIKIGMPSAQAREFYLSHKNPRLDSEPHELHEWVDATEGFSVAHLKELIISVECFNKTREEAVKRLRSMMTATVSSYEDDGTGKRVGF